MGRGQPPRQRQHPWYVWGWTGPCGARPGRGNVEKTGFLRGWRVARKGRILQNGARPVFRFCFSKPQPCAPDRPRGPCRTRGGGTHPWSPGGAWGAPKKCHKVDFRGGGGSLSGARFTPIETGLGLRLATLGPRFCLECPQTGWVHPPDGKVLACRNRTSVRPLRIEISSWASWAKSQPFPGIGKKIKIGNRSRCNIPGALCPGARVRSPRQRQVFGSLWGTVKPGGGTPPPGKSEKLDFLNGVAVSRGQESTKVEDQNRLGFASWGSAVWSGDPTEGGYPLEKMYRAGLSKPHPDPPPGLRDHILNISGAGTGNGA